MVLFCNDTTIKLHFFSFHILSLLDALPSGFSWPIPPAIPDDEYFGILNPPAPAPPALFKDPTGPPIPEPDPYL